MRVTRHGIHLNTEQRPQHKDCIATDQRIESVGLFLASFAGIKGIAGTPGTLDEKGKSLEKQKIAVS